ncbi:MAG TPA: hypothetical protein VHS97_02990, partial [Isosphaeraceae bacterium]|nr:hypothetical protein [Isosphaeraceae bacterium]
GTDGDRSIARNRRDSLQPGQVTSLAPCYEIRNGTRFVVFLGSTATPVRNSTIELNTVDSPRTPSIVATPASGYFQISVKHGRNVPSSRIRSRIINVK